MTSSSCEYTDIGCKLKPSDIKKELLLRVKAILYDSMEEGVEFGDCLKITGPAVNVLFKFTNSRVMEALTHPLFKTKQLSKDKKSIMISVDMTLAIEIEKSSDERRPLEGFCSRDADGCGGIVPTAEAVHYKNDVQRCHLVAKGGYWTISFASAESELLKKNS